MDLGADTAHVWRRGECLCLWCRPNGSSTHLGFLRGALCSHGPLQPAFSALAPLQSCSQATKASDLLTKWFASPIQFSQQLGGIDRASLLPLFMKEKTMDDRAGDLIDRAGDLPR